MWLLWPETPSLRDKFLLSDGFAHSSGPREKGWPSPWIRKMCHRHHDLQKEKPDKIAQNLHRSLQSFSTINSYPWCSQVRVSRRLTAHPCCPRGDCCFGPFLFAPSFFHSSMTVSGFLVLIKQIKLGWCQAPHPSKYSSTVWISAEYAVVLSPHPNKRASHFQNGQSLIIGLIACGGESCGRAPELCVHLSPFLPQPSTEHDVTGNQHSLVWFIVDKGTGTGWGASTFSPQVTSEPFLFPSHSSPVISIFPSSLRWENQIPRPLHPKVTQYSKVVPDPKSSALLLEQASCVLLLSKYCAWVYGLHADSMKDWLTAKVYFPHRFKYWIFIKFKLYGQRFG